MIKENVAEVEARIQAACERAGRRRDEVTLIAVSKTKPVSDIYEVMETGIKDYGENKVQEMCDKMEVIQQPLNWHMIGHLQRNKVKYIVDKAALMKGILTPIFLRRWTLIMAAQNWPGSCWKSVRN